MMHFELTNEEAERRIRRGRRKGSRNLNDFERESIAFEAHFSTAKQVAEKRGLMPSTVYQIKGGFIQTSEQRANGGAAANARDEKLLEKTEENLDKVRPKVVSTAAQKLLDAMNRITSEKLEDAKLRELSGVARDMASVIGRVEGKDKQGPAVQVVVYQPNVRNESQMSKVIEVGSETK